MNDYRNTAEGRSVRQKYADILALSRPEPIYPRMTTLNRAKIFSPFAALRGYDEELAYQERVHRLAAKTELSDEEKNNLSDKLLQIKKGMTVTVQYFKPDTVYAPLGAYKLLTGTVSRIEPVYRKIEIMENAAEADAASAFRKPLRTCISFDDLVQVTGNEITDS